jgi:hypothetical protein
MLAYLEFFFAISMVLIPRGPSPKCIRSIDVFSEAVE